jgi:outer membrane receptor protein involved in Fe transport
MHARRVAGWIMMATAFPAAAQPLPLPGESSGSAPLPALRVTAARIDPAAPGQSLAFWDDRSIASSAPRSIDEVLAQNPAFSLYRRQAAWFGNPTAAGVSLRNTAASAASRTLVLLDGIPQNDPFGSWVQWLRIDPSNLAEMHLIPSSRAAAWGSQSPAGIVQMHSHRPGESPGHVRLQAGSFHSLAASAGHSARDPQGRFGLSVSGFTRHSDGFHPVGPGQRGSIDRRLDLAASGLDLRGLWQPAEGISVFPSVSWFEEERGNGTPLSGNATRALDASLRLESSTHPDSSWQFVSYHQERDFESVFTSVNADRSAETLALDQYDVPGRGTGLAFALRRESAANSPSWTAGFDARWLRGETNERVGTFRDRQAGGRQSTLGLFLTSDHEPRPDLRLDASLRLDHWSLEDGVRRETLLSNGALVRDDKQPDRDGFQPSLAAGLAWEITEATGLQFSAGHGYRLPSLNELHRPFRVRNDIIEANPQLDPEHFSQLEISADWQPHEDHQLRLALFHHWIGDAIANVPVTDPAEIASLAGVLPPGGTLAQRRNVDQARVGGLQASWRWQIADDLHLTLDALRSRSRFTQSPGQPLLTDMPFPQAPDLRIVSAAHCRIHPAVELSAGWEYGSHQYDDSLAARRIPSYQSVQLAGSWEQGPHTIRLRIDNLFDDPAVTGLSGDGIRTLAAPRALWLEYHRTWGP